MRDFIQYFLLLVIIVTAIGVIGYTFNSSRLDEAEYANRIIIENVSR